jgi:hypothetical protein
VQPTCAAASGVKATSIAEVRDARRYEGMADESQAAVKAGSCRGLWAEQCE